MGIDHFFDKPKRQLDPVPPRPVAKPPLPGSQAPLSGRRLSPEMAKKILDYLREFPEGRSTAQVALEFDMTSNSARYYLIKHARVLGYRQMGGVARKASTIWGVP